MNSKNLKLFVIFCFLAFQEIFLNDGEIVNKYIVGNLEIIILKETSDRVPHPTISIEAPSGYKIIGGGAHVNWAGHGNLLTGIWPETATTWRASAKDHCVSDPSTITAYAICAKMKNGSSIASDSISDSFDFRKSIVI